MIKFLFYLIAYAGVSNPSLPVTDGTFSTSSYAIVATTDGTINAMTLTPGAGCWNSSLRGSVIGTTNNNDITISLYANGVQMGGTESACRGAVQGGVTPTLPIRCNLSTEGCACIGDGQAIDGRWRYPTNNGATITARSIRVTKVGDCL